MCVLVLWNKSKQSKRSMNALKAPNAFSEHILFGKKGTVVQYSNHKNSLPSVFPPTLDGIEKP